MRSSFVLLALALSLIAYPLSFAFAQPSAAECPDPSAEGSFIYPNTPCVLTSQGMTISFVGSELRRNGVPFTTALAATYSSTGKFWFEKQCGPDKVWYNDIATHKPQGASPAAGNNGPIFKNATTGVGYLTTGDLFENGASNQTWEIPPMPKGITTWCQGVIVSQPGVTIDLERGARLTASVQQSNAIIVFNKNPSHVTIRGGEIDWAVDTSSGQYRGINAGGAQDLTISGTYLHDNDFGIQASSYPSGTTRLINVVLDHNGSGANSSTTHNIYMTVGAATDASRIDITGGGSYCTDAGGFQYKSRWPGGAWTGFVAAAPSQHALDKTVRCEESAAIDLSCGGAYTLGGNAPGTGFVAEVGPNLQNNGGVIRYGAEAKSTNCPNLGPNHVGWAVNELTMQNCWLISDHPSNTPAVFNSNNLPVKIRNCKLVNVTLPHAMDGGGNTIYPNRKAAGLAAYPALPPPP